MRSKGPCRRPPAARRILTSQPLRIPSPLQDAPYWGSWFLTHWAALAVSSLLCVAVGSYPFAHSSLVVMIAFFWLFSAALVAFAYAQSTLFTTSRVAGTVSQFLYALSMLPGALDRAEARGGDSMCKLLQSILI